MCLLFRGGRSALLVVFVGVDFSSLVVDRLGRGVVVSSVFFSLLSSRGSTPTHARVVANHRAGPVPLQHTHLPARQRGTGSVPQHVASPTPWPGMATKAGQGLNTWSKLSKVDDRFTYNLRLKYINYMLHKVRTANSSPL